MGDVFWAYQKKLREKIQDEDVDGGCCVDNIALVLGQTIKHVTKHLLSYLHLGSLSSSLQEEQELLLNQSHELLIFKELL